MKERKVSDETPEIQFGSLRVAWLEAFVLSVRYQKRLAAAAEMGVTQGTVSKHIKSLECWCGSGRRLLLMQDNMWPPVLTEAGKTLLPKAENALMILKGFREVRQPQDEAGTELTDI